MLVRGLLQSDFLVGTFALLDEEGNIADVHFREMDLVLTVYLSIKCLSAIHI